jgi:quercetin dioxygenase-like cupin family protein
MEKNSWFNELKHVPKTWGFEIWVSNNENYCGKILVFEKGKYCSLHFHKLKTETFFCIFGKLQIFLRNNLTKEEKEFIMLPGDSVHIYPGLEHQMMALEDSQLMEISTTHFDSDSYRNVESHF